MTQSLSPREHELKVALARKAAPASVPFQRLDDLWFMLGSRCNLSCIHCYVGSSPANDTLEPLTLDEVQRFLDEGARHGLRHAYLTGGEPFLNPQVLPILEAALEGGREATVLTNATRPLARMLDDVVVLAKHSEGRLHLRVSLDHYQEARHDAIRGRGQFRLTVDTTVRLAEAGFHPIVTSTAEVFRGNPVSPTQCETRYKALFADLGVDVQVKILPSVLQMGSQLGRIDRPDQAPVLTEDTLQGARIDKGALMCANSRSVLKRDGQLRVYPCPILYEAIPDFDLGATLAESFARPVPLTHRACASYCCRASGPRGSCANG